MSEKLEPIKLREIFAHSAQRKILTIEDGNVKFDLAILPWSATQAQALGDLVGKVSNEIVGVLKEYQNKEEDFDWETAVQFLVSILQKKEVYDDILHIVYVTLERGNEVIKAKVGEQEITGSLFTEEEMRKWLPIKHIVEICIVILKLNVEGNLSPGLDLEKVLAKVKAPSQIAQETPELKVMGL